MWKLISTLIIFFLIINEIYCDLNDSSVINKNNNNANLNKTYNNLASLLNFYNTEDLVRNLKLFSANLTKLCEDDMKMYVNGLNNNQEWALKMDDASGRYTTGWYWGNHYWTGSKNLCENILPSDDLLSTKNIANYEKSRERRKVKSSTPSQVNGYYHGSVTYSSLPPFPVSFYMLRIILLNNTIVVNDERLLHVGFCLPKICTNDDIKLLIEEASKSTRKSTITVESVRNSHHDFHLFTDMTFMILCGVTFVIVMLLAIGTVYDLHLKHLEDKRKAHILNCSSYTSNNNNNNNHSKLNGDNIKLDMPDHLTRNKSHLYVVNETVQVVQERKTTLDPRDASFFRDVCKELILSFSVRMNLKNICDRSVGSDTIPVIHGLKAISMGWVILGHTCIVAFKYSDNMEFRRVVEKQFLFQTVSSGTFSVDTFFFTSGLLVAFLYFRTNAKGKLEKLSTSSSNFLSGCLHFVGLLAYRFARLSAPYLFVLGVVEVTMKWFHYNSIFEPPAIDHENCPKYWWRNILYVNTLFPVKEMCMLWSWYLADDTQFYIVGAILLILATHHFKTAMTLMCGFILSSWLTTGYIAYTNSHMPHLDDPLALFDKIYDKPWTRLGPYIIGMIVGWILFKSDCKISMSKLQLSIGWLSSFAVLLSLIFGLYEANLSRYAGAAYSSLSHSAWALGLAWIVIACSTGNGGYINSILSLTILYPFSRVTYCAYLVHPLMIRVMVMNMDSPIHLGKELLCLLFLGQVVVSYVLAFFISIAFEAPVVSMLRILSKLPTTSSNKKTDENT